MNRLTREADELIRKVVARYNTLYSASGSISQIELDLLLDDLRQMYDKFKTISLISQQHQHLDLPKFPKTASEPKESTAPPQTAPAENLPAQENKIVEKAKEVAPADKIEESTPAIPEKRIEEVVAVTEETQESAIIEEETQTVIPVLESEPVTPQKNESHLAESHQNAQTIADRFKNDQKSLSDVMSSGTSREGSIGSRLSHSTIADLKSVIGLAEKFAFINELFNGDPLAYEKAIVQLNGSSHLTEAETYLATLRLNHRWPADSPLVHLLYDMVRRKFNS